MASQSAGRRRTVCETCELPFYADVGSCPYCGTDTDAMDTETGGFVFDDGETAARTRTTCRSCGLPHYDDVEGCPYCEQAGVSMAGTDSPDATTESTVAPDERSSLFGRIKRTLGF